MEFAAAVEWWVEHHPDEGDAPFRRQILAAFAPVLRHPQLRPPYPLPGSTGLVLRRVDIWHFAFLYRVNETMASIIITRIFHERSAEL